MQVLVTITDKVRRWETFPFDAPSPAAAAHEVAADGDWEPEETILIEVDDGKHVRKYSVETRPFYEPVLQATWTSPGRLH